MDIEVVPHRLRHKGTWTSRSPCLVTLVMIGKAFHRGGERECWEGYGGDVMALACIKHTQCRIEGAYHRNSQPYERRLG